MSSTTRPVVQVHATENGERETFRLPQEMFDQVEQLVDEGDLYASRSDVYRIATRNLLEDHDRIEADGEHDRLGGDLG